MGIVLIICVVLMVWLAESTSSERAALSILMPSVFCFIIFCFFHFSDKQDIANDGFKYFFLVMGIISAIIYFIFVLAKPVKEIFKNKLIPSLRAYVEYLGILRVERKVRADSREIEKTISIKSVLERDTFNSTEIEQIEELQKLLRTVSDSDVGFFSGLLSVQKQNRDIIINANEQLHSFALSFRKIGNQKEYEKYERLSGNAVDYTDEKDSKVSGLAANYKKVNKFLLKLLISVATLIIVIAGLWLLGIKTTNVLQKLAEGIKR